MLHNRKINNDLAEELDALGFTGGGKKLAYLASARLDEAIYGGITGEDTQTIAEDADGTEAPVVQEAPETDPLNGPYLTIELLDRVDALDFENATVEDCEAVLAGLEAKVLNPALTEEDAQELEERFKKTVNKFGKIVKKKILTGVEKLKGKKSRRKNRAKIKATARKYKRKGGRMLKRIRARFAGKIAGKKKQIAAGVEVPMSDLAVELRGLLSENTIEKNDFDPTLEKMCDVFDLIEWHLEDSSVSEVLEDAVYDLWAPLLEESVESEEFTERCKPVLSLMAHCLKEIDGTSGN